MLSFGFEHILGAPSVGIDGVYAYQYAENGKG